MKGVTSGGFTCDVWLWDLSSKLEVDAVPDDRSKVAFCIRGTNRHQLPMNCVVHLRQAWGINNPQRLAFDRATDSSNQKWIQPALMTLAPAPPKGFTRDVQVSGVWKVGPNVGSSETISTEIEFSITRATPLTLHLGVDL